MHGLAFQIPEILEHPSQKARTGFISTHFTGECFAFFNLYQAGANPAEVSAAHRTTRNILMMVKPQTNTALADIRYTVGDSTIGKGRKDLKRLLFP
jgi:hypothetical protein